MVYTKSSCVAAFISLLVGLFMSGCQSNPSDGASQPPPAPSVGPQTVTYTKNLQLDIIQPKEEKSLHRGIVLIHGGGWKGGDRTEMTEIGLFLAAKGFTTLCIDYRLAPASVWPAQLDDAQTAVRYLRSQAKNLNIDPSQIGACGISAGGHLAMFLGAVETWKAGDFKVRSSHVQAVCSISGIHDLNQPLTEAGERFKIVQALLGEKVKANKAARAKASPDTYFTKKTAPTLFIQGSADPLVPLDQSVAAEKKLTALSVPARTIIVEKMGHGLSPQDASQAKALDEVADWMKKYLGVQPK